MDMHCSRTCCFDMFGVHLGVRHMCTVLTHAHRNRSLGCARGSFNVWRTLFKEWHSGLSVTAVVFTAYCQLVDSKVHRNHDFMRLNTSTSFHGGQVTTESSPPSPLEHWSWGRRPWLERWRAGGGGDILGGSVQQNWVTWRWGGEMMAGPYGITASPQISVWNTGVVPVGVNWLKWGNKILSSGNFSDWIFISWWVFFLKSILENKIAVNLKGTVSPIWAWPWLSWR
jgi:hypothetical protein